MAKKAFKRLHMAKPPPCSNSGFAVPRAVSKTSIADTGIRPARPAARTIRVDRPQMTLNCGSAAADGIAWREMCSMAPTPEQYRCRSRAGDSVRIGRWL